IQSLSSFSRWRSCSSRLSRAGCPPAGPAPSIPSSPFTPNELCQSKIQIRKSKTLMIDLRFAIRQLLKSPAFTFLAVVTLALGIGMNTAIFSLINDLFLKGLPFQKPDELV